MTLIKFQHPRVKRFFENEVNFPGFNNAFDSLLKMDYNYGEVTPSVNVTENDQEFTMEYLVPGFKKEEIKIALEQNVLTVKAERKSESTDEQKRYTRKEFSFNSYKRSFTLPESIDAEKLTAKHEHGILSIVIPKKTEDKTVTSKEIEIQ